MARQNKNAKLDSTTTTTPPSENPSPQRTPEKRKLKKGEVMSNEFGILHPDGTTTDYELWLELFDADELPDPSEIRTAEFNPDQPRDEKSEPTTTKPNETTLPQRTPEEQNLLNLISSKE